MGCLQTLPAAHSQEQQQVLLDEGSTDYRWHGWHKYINTYTHEGTQIQFDSVCVLHDTTTHCLVLSELALVHRKDPSLQCSQLPPSHGTQCEVSVQPLCTPQPLQTGR